MCNIIIFRIGVRLMTVQKNFNSRNNNRRINVNKFLNESLLVTNQINKKTIDVGLFSCLKHDVIANLSISLNLYNLVHDEIKLNKIDADDELDYGSLLGGYTLYHNKFTKLLDGLLNVDTRRDLIPYVEYNFYRNNYSNNMSNIIQWIENFHTEKFSLYSNSEKNCKSLTDIAIFNLFDYSFNSGTYGHDYFTMYTSKIIAITMGNITN